MKLQEVIWRSFKRPWISDFVSLYWCYLHLPFSMHLFFFFDNNNNNNDIVTIINLLPLKSDWQRRIELLGNKSGGGGESHIYWRRCSSKFAKETPKNYHIGCGSSQFYSLKVTSEIFIHRNNTGTLKIIAKRQQVLLQMNEYWHVTRLANSLKVTVLTQSANVFLLTP